MVKNEKYYRFSKAIIIKENRFFNMLTLESFSIKSALIEIYNQFKNQIFAIQEIISAYNNIYDSSKLQDILCELIKNNILIEQDTDDTFVIIPPIYSILSPLKLKDIDNISHSIILIGIPYGKGNTISNDTIQFPDKYRKFLYANGVKKINRIQYTAGGIFKYNKDFPDRMYDIGNIFIYQNEYNNISHRRIEYIYDRIAKNRNIIFALGGDHSIVYPILKSFSKRNDKIIYLHLDAHTDNYISFVHDLLQEKNYACVYNGNFVRKIAELDEISKIIQYGIRGIANLSVSNESKLFVYHLKKDKSSFISELSKITKSDSIYLSIDIDFFDPSFAPGTDFPEICGASLNDFIEIWDSLRELRNQIIGIDIVEINPNKDTMDMTFQLSTIIITKILNSLMP